MKRAGAYPCCSGREAGHTLDNQLIIAGLTLQTSVLTHINSPWASHQLTYTSSAFKGGRKLECLEHLQPTLKRAHETEVLTKNLIMHMGD